MAGWMTIREHLVLYALGTKAGAVVTSFASHLSLTQTLAQLPRFRITIIDSNTPCVIQTLQEIPNQRLSCFCKFVCQLAIVSFIEEIFLGFTFSFFLKESGLRVTPFIQQLQVLQGLLLVSAKALEFRVNMSLQTQQNIVTSS